MAVNLRCPVCNRLLGYAFDGRRVVLSCRKAKFHDFSAWVSFQQEGDRIRAEFRNKEYPGKVLLTAYHEIPDSQLSTFGIVVRS